MSHPRREQPAWTMICHESGQRVRRFATEHGWLYQVETNGGWHTPVYERRDGKR